MDPGSLQRLSDGREAHSDVVSLLGTRVPAVSTPPDVVRYVPCPECGTLMNRKNFAQSSGVVLDVCARHGVWLDRGELERVLGFVAGGGLTRARIRERQRLVEEQRRLIALQKAPLGQGLGGEVGSFTRHDMTWGRAIPPSANESFGRMLLDALDIVSS